SCASAPPCSRGSRSTSPGRTRASAWWTQPPDARADEEADVTYLAPGVYIEEVASGPQPIAAAPTSVVAIVGTTERGPVMDPRRVTGWGQFLEVFGGTTSRGYTAESVFGFFENGGPAAYVVRVDPSIGAEWIVRDTTGNEAFRVNASSPGAWANDLA